MNTDEAKKRSYWIIELIFTAWDWIRAKINEWGAMNGKR